MARKAILVCGYGCELNEKIISYLNRVIRFVSENNHIDLILTAGGFSQKKTHPHKSEAQIMAGYLRRYIRHIAVAEENESLTTWSNMKNGRRKIDEFGNFQELVIFCDAVRAARAKLFAEKFFSDYPVIRVETGDLSPRGSAKKQIIAGLNDILVSQFSVLGLLRENTRKIRAQFI